MDDVTRWERISCADREALVDRLGRSFNGFSPASGIVPLSGLTDLDGQFGTPVVRTVWGHKDGRPVLEDIRWPSGDKPCEHYIPND